ncbi:enamine deaminase RidA (YjgF/YER057c/UK114 family) [Mesorhizobium soli]|uniref:RidA family protein n=1 Tax=Pseudaminobacter soli (ex Li et al. 2025) TaxID=1295366 RepID=UPI002473B64D|nr:RidA family protein [Mesorhizobium soli]MDH6235036.1 enamine deaminase RidA (YjgF/YER057c/UK114 family) [Mesorhizobium soli]
MPERRAISSGSRFEKLAGYSRAVVDGEFIFISATAGAEVDGSFSGETVQQARRALAIVGSALAEAEADLDDVVRVRVYLADRADVMAVSKILGETFDAPRPANTTIICGFPDEQIKVELEMTALKRR